VQAVSSLTAENHGTTAAIQRRDSSYRIASDHAVATISIGDLVGALARDAEILSGEQTDSNDIRSYDDDGTDVDVRVSRVVTGYTLGKRDEHPVHGSGTGTNFKIDEDDDTWRCWRHDCTGNAMHMVGMQAGIVDCGDWKQGGLSSEIWADIFEEARNRGIIDDDRRAATAEELAGSGEHEKGDLDDDEDSSKVPKASLRHSLMMSGPTTSNAPTSLMLS